MAVEIRNSPVSKERRRLIPDLAAPPMPFPDTTPLITAARGRPYILGSRQEARRFDDVFASVQKEARAMAIAVRLALKAEGLDETKINSYLDGLLGPLRLEKDVLMPEDEILSKDQKEDSARVSQAMVEYLVYATADEAPAEFAQLMQTVVSTMESISTTLFGQASHFNQIWAGIKYEFAVIKLLTQAGYNVYQPDHRFTEAIRDDPDDDGNEIRHWDVAMGVDLIAVPHGSNVPILLDSKGRKFREYEGEDREEPRRREVNQIIEVSPKFNQGLNPSLRKFLQKEGLSDRFSAGIIIMPGDARILRRFVEDREAPKEALRRFATMPIGYQAMFKDAIGRLISYPPSRSAPRAA